MFRNGINYNELPEWQRRGIGVYWERYEKLGINPVTGAQVSAERRRLKVDLEVPMKDEYDAFVRGLISRAS